MNTEFYRLIGSLQAVVHFIETQHHAPDKPGDNHGPDPAGKESTEDIRNKLGILRGVTKELLDEQAKISHAYFDFRRAMSRNAESFYHTIDYLRRKAPEWQIMDEDLLRLIENYQATASSMFFGGDSEPPVKYGSSSS